MFEKSVWLFELHNMFKVLDGLTSEQSYRRLIDNIKDLDDAFDEGLSVHDVYDSWE